MATSTIKADALYKKANWTATSSSATGTRLTEQITLTPGLWLISGTIPNYTSSNKLAQISLENVEESFRRSDGNYSTTIWLLKITSNTTVSILAGAGVSVTFDAIYRGEIAAVRLS